MISAAITFYSFVLFLHVAAVVVAFGGLFALPLLLGAGGLDAARVLTLLRAVVNPAGVVVLAAGLYLALDGPYEFGDPWIGTTLLILVVVMGIVGAYLIPRARRLPDAAALLQFRRGLLAADVLVLVAIFLMVTKPGA
jgi:uncharacterized membrane protein